MKRDRLSSKDLRAIQKRALAEAATKPAAAGPYLPGNSKRSARRRGFTQEELATIAGLSVHAVSALERGERRRPHVETVRALSAALDLTAAARDALLASARAPAHARGRR